ncbi:MAG: ATP-binding cassette domain-containing protein, partial [Cyanobacteriota bacterium]
MLTGPMIEAIGLGKSYAVAPKSPGLKGTLQHFFKRAYREVQAVEEVSFNIQPGEVVGFLGPNGAGKTTCFYMLVGLVKPDSGRVLLDQKDLTQLPMFERARLGIGYLPQEASIFRKLSVEDNIRSILELTDLD